MSEEEKTEAPVDEQATEEITDEAEASVEAAEQAEADAAIVEDHSEDVEDASSGAVSESSPTSKAAMARLEKANREVPISTVVRMLGLPTKPDLGVLEKKVDILTNKVTQMTLKMDRSVSQMSQVFHDFDRIDVQLSDLKGVLKGVLAAAISQSETAIKEQLDTLESRAMADKNDAASAASDGDGEKGDDVTVLSSE